MIVLHFTLAKLLHTKSPTLSHVNHAAPPPIALPLVLALPLGALPPALPPRFLLPLGRPRGRFVVLG